MIIMDTIELKNQLWPTCTNSNSYRSCQGDSAGSKPAPAEFDSLATCHNGRWPSGKALVCKTRNRGFDPRPIVHGVVRPKLLPPIGEHSLMPG